MPKFPIGIDNFCELVKENYLMVDHTLMIRDFVESGDKLSLILRPRRWGKSLILSMLYYFLAINERGAEHIFDHLNIGTFDGEEFLKKNRGQHPAILISLKDIKELTFQDFLESMAEVIRRLYSSHKYLLQSDKLIDSDKETFYRYLKSSANKAELAGSLQTLSEFLHDHFGQSVYILIDEYDTPMNSAYHNETELKKIARFMKKC